MSQHDKKFRQNQLLKIALKHAKKVGYANVTRKTIADEADIAESLVTYYLGSMPKVKRAIMRAAVRDEVLPVVAQGLVDGNPHAKKAPQELREKALASLIGA